MGSNQLPSHCKSTQIGRLYDANKQQQTDTHGWLEGHLKEENYGADWGDFASFTSHMSQKASDLGVDLLLIDTGK